VHQVRVQLSRTEVFARCLRLQWSSGSLLSCSILEHGCVRMGRLWHLKSYQQVPLSHEMLLLISEKIVWIWARKSYFLKLIGHLQRYLRTVGVG
jgi:hypothetical protein